MIVIEQRVGEDRKDYLVRLAIAYIESHTGFIGIDDIVYYDEAECDGYALAEDLKIEFEVEDSE
jgi:hypothetical protein